MMGSAALVLSEWAPGSVPHSRSPVASPDTATTGTYLVGYSDPFSTQSSTYNGNGPYITASNVAGQDLWFGPYTSINAGNYVANFMFKKSSGATGWVWIDVTANDGSTGLATYNLSLSNVGTQWTTIPVTFSAGSSYSNVEFRGGQDGPHENIAGTLYFRGVQLAPSNEISISGDGTDGYINAQTSNIPVDAGQNITVWGTWSTANAEPAPSWGFTLSDGDSDSDSGAGNSYGCNLCGPSNYASTTTAHETGTYNLQLYISHDESGETQPSANENIPTVNSDPAISISGSSSTDVGQSKTYQASYSGGTSPYYVKWILNGNVVATGTSYTFDPGSTGTYSLYARLLDGSDYYATSNTLSIGVSSDPAISVSSSNNPSDANQQVTFSTSVSGGSGGYTYSYVLYDGTSTSDSQLASGSSSSFSYTFSATGSYLLDYSVTDSNGYTVSASLTQTVNSDPTVSISSSQNPTDVGNTIEFKSSVSGGTPGYSYSWSADGSSYTTQDINVSFSSSGTYSIDLTVKDAAGYSVSTSYSETVNSDPTVTASSNVSSADVNYPIEFSSSPSGGSGGYTYSWTLNGNQVSTSQDFSYSFSSSGSYTLTVTITDSVGKTSSATVSVTINPNPSVSVSSSQNPTDVGNSVTFSSSVSGGTGTDTYVWTINGVQESTASGFSYSFSSPGTFYVNVTVTDSDGHTASYSLKETVNPDPSVVIHAVHNPTDVGIWANFSSSVSGGTGPYTYSWSVNGQSYTTPYVNYTFTSSGTFPVDLTVTDANGNQASYTVNEVVNPDPSVSIQVTYSKVDQGINDTFYADVTGGTSPFNYTWTLGSKMLNYSQQFHMNFTATGSYQVNLTVVDSLGLNASSSFSVQVIQKPSALIEGSNQTDVSTTTYWEGYGSYGSAPYNYYWFINGVNTSSGLYLQYSFPKIGRYNITLLIDDSQGSKAYAYLNITVENLPKIALAESKQATDVGIPAYFNS